MSNSKVTTATIREMKEKNQPIVMLTAYDYAWARMFDEAGVDMLLVGDSLGNVVLGYDSTLPVTMEDMIHHGKAVQRGAKRAMVVVDMPFMSYQICKEDALRNAGRIMKETGAQAVKLEGGAEIVDTIKAIVDAGIPVVAHLGLTPQSVHQLGGFKVQGRKEETAKKLLDDAIKIAQAGAFAIVLECVPALLAQLVSKNVSVPTIGIGAGVGCDGQVLVYHDMLGLTNGFVPKFAKQYRNFYTDIIAGVQEYAEDVRTKKFPSEEYSFSMGQEVLSKLY